MGVIVAIDLNGRQGGFELHPEMFVLQRKQNTIMMGKAEAMVIASGARVLQIRIVNVLSHRFAFGEIKAFWGWGKAKRNQFGIVGFDLVRSHGKNLLINVFLAADVEISMRGEIERRLFCDFTLI